MCGIIGGVGNFGLDGQKMIKMMLMFDQVRGFNSTGIACIDDDGVYTYKKAVHGTDFLEYKQTNSLMDCYKNKAIIGHNRAATKGAVINANAHPFNHGDITGVHNGTLRVQSNLKDWREFDVDSDNIFYNIDECGVDETLKILNGAFTLVWWDEGTDTLSLVRNNERPLLYAYTVDGSALYYASEYWMLEVSAIKCGVKLGDIVKLPVGKLMTIDLGEGYNKLKTLINTRVNLREVEFYVPYIAPKPTYLGYQRAIEHYVDFTLTRFIKDLKGDKYFGVTTCGADVEVKCYGGTIPKLNVKYTGHTKCKVWIGTKPVYKLTDYTIELQDTLTDLVAWGDTMISPVEFEKRIDMGCRWCCDSVMEDKDRLILGPTEFVCSGCKDLPEVKEYLKEV